MKAKKLNTIIEEFDNPEVLGVGYDLNNLVIFYKSNSEDTYDIVFKDAIGFKCLDEGDMLHYWNHEIMIKNWLVEISTGGWMDLESSTNGFVSVHNQNCREFFVMGINDCVSIIAFSEPEIKQKNN